VVVATWNVNGILTRLPLVLAWLQARQPDVLCLQELKVDPRAFPLPSFWALGYAVAHFAEGPHNGVAICSRRPISEVVTGLGDRPDPEARLIAGTIEGVRVLSAYVPHGRALDHPYYRHKLEWLARLRTHLEAHYRADQPIILCGDFNVAPEAKDVWDPQLWARKVHYHIDARVALKSVTGFGLTDTFRQHHPGGGLYSWWDYQSKGAFEKNRGLRIDHLYATEPLARRSLYSAIDREPRRAPHPSDHAPVLSAFA